MSRTWRVKDTAVPRPIEALIHIDALAHNLQRARQAAPDSRVWAVLKANAYGHGIERSAGAGRSCCWKGLSKRATWSCARA
jgi:alanine racemase